MENKVAVLFLLASMVAVSGCVQGSGPDSGTAGPEPYQVPAAVVTVEAEVTRVETRNVSGTNPDGEKVTSPDDSVTLEIREIKSVENPEGVDYSLEGGDTLTLATRYGARPVQVIEIPAGSQGQEDDSAVSLTEWSEWEGGGFLFFRKSQTFETRRIVTSLPGMEKEDIVETTLVYPRNNGVQEISEYTVVR